MTIRPRVEKMAEDHWRAPENIPMLEYKAAYYHDRDSGWYTASVLDFPGVLSQGKTLDKARRMLGDALREMTEWLLEDGQALPRPDPTANDAEATVIEPIQLLIHARSRMVGP